MKRTYWIAALLLVLALVPALAQTTDPAIAAAKEETTVVYDLGRFFGYIVTLEQEHPDLALSDTQAAEILDVMTQIEGMERVEPDWASDTLDYLELDLLTPAQLLAVDKIALARETTSTSGTGTGAGGGTGSGPLQTYINGGAFNPITDDSKTIGQGFYELMKMLD